MATAQRTHRIERALAAVAAVLLVALLSVPGGLPGQRPVARASHGPPPGTQGLQGGWAVDDSGQVNFYHSASTQFPIMRDAGAGWVRINFRLGACFRDWTRRGCNGRTALQVYSEVVSNARSNNLQVLALLSNESWPGSQAQWIANNAEVAGGTGDNRYVRDFAERAAGVLAAHFDGSGATRPLVEHWEIWNEPNAWTYLDAAGNPAGGTFLYASNFAWLLTRAHAAIKRARPAAVVVAGGVFGHDLGGASVAVLEDGVLRRVTKRGDLVGAARRAAPAGAAAGPAAPAPTPAPTPTPAVVCSSTVPSGADYLCETYAAGRARAGWTAGASPFDHVGQHLYLDQGGTTSSGKVEGYLQDVRGAYLAYEGAGTTKRTHVTEFGWETRAGYTTLEQQAANLQLAYAAFASRGYVERGYWFTVQDVSEGGIYFGLAYDDYSHDVPATAKPSFTAYQTYAR